MHSILILEGNPAAARERGRARGLSTTGEIYARALRAECPALAIDTVFPADGETLSDVAPLDRYAGAVVTGSSLHAYEDTLAVTSQLDMLRRVTDAGLPVLGSCWGLQLAVVAAGGTVEANPAGAEIGVARKIVPTSAGAVHPLLAGRGAVFDAPCIHHDHVTCLPLGATLLASNNHSGVQAATIPLGHSEVWAVQYHPEFDLPHLAGLYEMYADEMVADGFFEDGASVSVHAEALRRAIAGPRRSPFTWMTGLDADLLDGPTRRTEIRNWLRHAADCLQG